MRELSPIKLVLGAAVLGVIAGVGLSFKRQHDDELKLRALKAELKTLSPEHFPPAAPPPKAHAEMSVPLIDAETMQGIPIYPNSNPRNLASSVKGQGLEMKVGWFSTRDSLDDVINFYARKFADDGHVPVRHKYNEKAGYVGFLDMNTEKLHLITVLRQPKETLVFPSASYPGKLLEGKAQVPPSVPVYPGTAGSMVFDFDEGMQARRSYFATVNDRTVADVVEFYKKGFAANGWSIEEVNEAVKTEVRIDARRGAGSCNVVVKKRDQEVAIYVSIVGQV